ncbi:hypothetical protein MASR2M78_10020 [Treponema sp.]
MKLPENAILGLLDRKGQRLFFYPPKPTNPLGGRIQESVWKGILSGEDSGVLIDRGSDAVSRFYTYKKLRLSKTEEPYMYVVYAIPTALLYGPSRTVLLRNLLIMAAAAFFILLVALYSSNRLFGRRLERIVSTVNSINSGNLSARLNFSDDVSDLGRIAHALDRMTETIQRRNIEQVASAHVLMENLAEKELLLKEVHHRVKNNLQLILSFFTLQEGSAEGPEGLKIAMENRIRAMSMVHEKLQKSTDLQEIDLGDYTRQLAQLIVSSIDRSLIVPVDAGRVLSTLEKAIPYGLMLTELLSNVAKHAFNDAKEGTLFISLQSINNDVVLLVHDDGETLPSDFPNSKSAELALSIIRALVSQLHGKITWESGQGTSFTVVFPLV